MRRHTPLLVAVLAIALLGAAPAIAPGLTLTQMSGTFSGPVYVASPPQDASRVYVVERRGTIRLIENGTVRPADEFFLDIRSLVDSEYGEEGLLSAAFAPDFATSRRFYVFYTAKVTEAEVDGSDLVIEERTAAADGRSTVGAGKEILRIDHRQYANHDGGQLQFGPDDHLWIGTGDGGSGNDPLRNAQNSFSLLGKLLRISPTPGGGYTIPSGNPFAAGGGAPEVWALGLRNPWRFSFDRGTGDLMIGDVGQNAVEEVDRAPAPGLGCGSNYGWRPYEGNVFREQYGPAPAQHHAPLFTHSHDDGWVSITGGYVIRDPELAEAGRYVYGDYGISELRTADPASGANEATGRSVAGLSSFGEDANGRLYVTSLDDGRVYRLTDGGASSGALIPAAKVGVPGCGPPPPPGGQPPPDGGSPTLRPGGTPPSGGGPAGAPTDPTVFAGVARRQRALRRGRVFVRAGCHVACRLTLAGRLAVGRRRVTLVGSSVTLPANRRRTLVAKLGPKAKRAARRGLRRGASVRAALVLTARTTAGGSTRRTLRVSVTR